MSDMGHGTGSGLREDAENLGETVQMQAVEVKEKGREQISSQLDERTTQVGQQAKSFAEALRRSGNEMQGQNGGTEPAARISTAVADRIERAGGYLERARGDDLLRDAERFARERPWVVAGMAAAAGFAASRFLKASSERRHGRYGTYESYGASGDDRWDRHGDTIESSRYAGTGTPAH
jgi:ElaB/YqjD/DUF883 family membrane-anchored ribosome-binding protein